MGRTGPGARGYWPPLTAGGGDSSPSAILNMCRAPACHWYWWYTSAVLGVPDDNYRQRGDAIFIGAMSCSAGMISHASELEPIA